MSQGFDELGLRPELTTEISAAGWDRPTAIQRASVPVLRRGGSVVIRAPAGSGGLSAALLGAVDRLAGQEPDDPAGARSGGIAAIIVSPTDARATRVAEAASRCGAPVGLRAAAIGGGWRETGAAIMAGTAGSLLRGVQNSVLKLDGVLVVIVDGVVQIQALGGAHDLEALLQVVPREAQRVLLTAESTPEVDRLAEAHARRAMHVPARPADPGATRQAAQHPDGDVGYVVAAAGERVEILARLLGDYESRRRAVVTRSEAAAGQLREQLQHRGFDVGDDDGSIRVGRSGEPPDADLVIGYGAPLDAADFADTFRSGTVFVLGAAELAQLRDVAGEANLELKPLSPSRGASPSLDAYRARIRRALDEEDIDSQLLVLEPLFDERSAAEVAAALSALLRGRREREAPAPANAAPRTDAARGPSGATPAYVRLFISAGQRDSLRPADIVGAIAGEAGVPGGQVGKIEIRDTFTVVEVPADAAERVIRALNGTTMRGRSLRVDFDRKGSAGGGGGAPPRPRRTRPG